LVQQRRLVWALSTYSLTVFFALVTFVFIMFPQIKWTESMRLSLAIKPRLTEKHKLLEYDLADYTPLFYANGLVDLTPEGYLHILTVPQQLYRYLLRQKEASVLVDDSDLEWM